MSLIEKHLFEKKGSGGCSDSDYHLVRLSCCRNFAVEDDELLDLYTDPHDLSRVVALEKGVRCPFCGAEEWNRDRIEDFADMPEEWRWAAPRDLVVNKSRQNQRAPGQRA